MNRLIGALLASCVLLPLSSCGPKEQVTSATAPDAGSKETEQAAIAASVDGDRLRRAVSTPAEWLTYGFSYDEQRFSPLQQVDTSNVSDLGVAWTYDLQTSRGVESTPIVVDGVMYVTSAWSVVYALDAATGDEIWVYDPEVDRAVGVDACCDVVNRGVAVWEGKIYVGATDGRLIALDAATGEEVWSTQTTDKSQPYTITGAPRIVDGRVFIGNGGAELGVRGYISAYNATSGKMEWRFYTVPNPNKQPDNAASDSAFENVGNVSWGDDGQWTTDGGGGTVWDSIIYDQVNDLLIFGVGNGSPWNQKVRDPSMKDNLFLSSIVAVKPDTGEYVWHFQTTPGDNWDYTATQSLILADIELDGSSRRVVMQAPKNGYFYVLDAATGEFISGNNYVPQNWTSGLDEEGRPIELAEARYGAEPYMIFPGPLGGHNWHPMAFSPDTGLAYIPAQEIPLMFQADANALTKPAKWNTAMDFSAATPVVPDDALFDFLRAGLKGRLVAWDPETQTEKWSHEHNNAWNGGVLTTAGGLVFQGQLEGAFAAYNAADGSQLWEYDVKSGAASGPATYEIDGEQYVTITTGWGSAYALAAGGFAYDEILPPSVGKVVTFKLGATGAIADPQLPDIERVAQTEAFGDDAMLQNGLVQYARNCSVCHGALALSSGVLPDLRWSPLTADAEAWNDVVIKGSLAPAGMVSFAQQLTDEDAEAIRAYVVTQAHVGAKAD